MLANDSCTVGCEVPVYLTAEEIGYYKSRGFFVTLPEPPNHRIVRDPGKAEEVVQTVFPDIYWGVARFVQ